MSDFIAFFNNPDNVDKIYSPGPGAKLVETHVSCAGGPALRMRGGVGGGVRHTHHSPAQKPENTHTCAQAVIIIGYDIVNRFWLLQNSWGSAWNKGGRFKVRHAAGIEAPLAAVESSLAAQLPQAHRDVCSVGAS
jgi:hypothetical protein